LSAREQEVLEHISRGATNAEIAGQLDVSVRTVQKHLENLFRQFAVHERAAVVAEAFRKGLLS
jgi:DNA-binding NarL/FixJ family response regulator